MPHEGRERGIALVLTILALVVMGGLVAGGFFVGMRELAVGKNTVKLLQAFAAADGGAQGVVASWSANTSTYGGLDVGDSTPHTPNQTWLPGRSGWYRHYVKRLSSTFFLVSSEGFSHDSTGRQRVGVLVRLRALEPRLLAALEVQGATTIGGSSSLDGTDHPPTGWTGCPPLQPTVGALATKDTTLVSFASGRASRYLVGSPLIRKDTTLTTSELTAVGGAKFSDLAALATIRLTSPSTLTGIGPVVAGGKCVTSNPMNWGDPENPSLACGDHFPIVYINGDVSINGGQGQGILLVSGDLSVGGGFSFFGTVIVQGHLQSTSTGGRLMGGVIAAGVGLEQNTILGATFIGYSSCAVRRASINSAVGMVVNERGWVNLN